LSKLPSPPSLREPLLTFAGATLLAAGLALLGQVIPFLGSHLNVAIAAIFLYAPALVGRLVGVPFDYREAGLRLDPLGLNLRVLGVAVAIAFPVFAFAFFIFYGVVCGPHGGFVAPMFAGLCPHWRGLAHGTLRLPPELLTSALNQLFVVAIPEELFFRGYLMPRLDRRWAAGERRRTLFGAPVGKALLVSSLLFALGHVVVIPNPQRLAVFFPALVFGWMRARTGSIVPGAVFHALCNLFADALHTSYF
jgi:membrane protease YdiL (CAAX protease family)